MQTVEIRFEGGENKITEYRNADSLSSEDLEVAQYIRDSLDRHKEQMRQNRIDKALDGYIIKGKRVEIRRKPTVWERAADFLSGFDIVDVLLTAALVVSVIVAARW